jgi:hypothetical protein
VSTLTEIEEALPKLSAQDLKKVASVVDRLFRERKGTAIYDDAYGTQTEADLIIAAERAFQEYDREEDEHAKRQAR